MTLKECKDQVAKKHGEKSWKHLEENGFGIGTGELLSYADEAAELYARSKWDEACEAQKTICVQSLPFPHRQLAYNSLQKLITDSHKPEFKP